LALQHLAGIVVARDGDLPRAASLLGFIDTQFARAGFVRETTERFGYERDLGAIRARLGAEPTAEAIAAGRRYTDERAITEALRSWTDS
jgi:hypothetical protein